MESNRHRREQFFLIACYISGILAILPYLIWMIMYYFYPGEHPSSVLEQVALGLVLVVAPCNGLFFGGAGLVSGLFLFFRKGGRYYARRFAVILPGLFLSVVGLVLDVWWWYIILKTA